LICNECTDDARLFLFLHTGSQADPNGDPDQREIGIRREDGEGVGGAGLTEKTLKIKNMTQL
jgi:hypothetical protein